MTIVLLNCSASSQSVTINIPSFGANISSFDCYTSSDANYWNNSHIAVNAGQVTVTIPRYGIVTLFGQSACVSCDFQNDGEIDFADYAVLASQWDTGISIPSADTNGDGIIDWNNVKDFTGCWLISTF